MGTFGCYVIAYSDRPLCELPLLAAYEHELESPDEEPQGRGAWRTTLIFDGTDIGPETLRELAEVTARPVLAGHVVDSDFVEVHGHSAGGAWCSVLARDVALSMLEMDFPDAQEALATADSMWLRPAQAAACAAIWARDAGHEADEEALRVVFEQTADPFAEQLFDDLVYLLGAGGERGRPDGHGPYLQACARALGVGDPADVHVEMRWPRSGSVKTERVLFQWEEMNGWYGQALHEDGGIDSDLIPGGPCIEPAVLADHARRMLAGEEMPYIAGCARRADPADEVFEAWLDGWAQRDPEGA